jgi:DNA-binding transcriptional LysR family regulator
VLQKGLLVSMLSRLSADQGKLVHMVKSFCRATPFVTRTVARGDRPQMVQEAVQFHVIISLVAAGLGIALVPASIHTFQRPDVVYLPLQGITTQAEIQVVWQRADRSPVVRSFLDVVKAHIHAESTTLSDVPD